jgi:hypothetical protein
MAMAMRLVVVPRRPREAAPRGQIRVQRRLDAVLRRFFSELAALPDHGARSTICRRNSFAFRRFRRSQ